MQRVETYVINKSSDEYLALKDLCHKSKNLYNYVNYIIRQVAFGKLDKIPEYRDLVTSQTKTYTNKKTGEAKEYTQNFISEFSLSKRLQTLKQSDYKSLRAQCSQQTISLLFKSYKAFYKSISDYYKCPSKYNGKPKMPSYRNKDGLFTIVYTNQSATINKDGHPKLSKDLILKTVTTKITKRNFCQIRIVPRLDSFNVEIVYNKTEGEYTRQAKERNKKLYNAAIDIGVGNLATVTSDNTDSTPFIVNGRPLKSINQFFNKKLADIKQVYSKHNIKSGKKSKRLNQTRNRMIKDYMHKSSRRIVDWCILNDIGYLYIGHNSGWKQEADMSKRNNQNFVSIPFNMLINMLRYKLEEIDVEVETVGEAYTSKCSALDNETIEKHNRYCGKRVKRGLFKSKEGKLLNADVNGSYNILRLGSKKKVNIVNPFNPYKTKNINEISDICYFEWKNKSTDRGSVLESNSVDMNENLCCTSIKE